MGPYHRVGDEFGIPFSWSFCPEGGGFEDQPGRDPCGPRTAADLRPFGSLLRQMLGGVCRSKNARRRRAWIVFQDESGVSQRPPVRRTWAPRGETPVLIHTFNWAKLSLAVGLAFRWDFRRSGLFFQTRPGSYNDVALIGFLSELKRHLGGRRLILIWGWPAVA